MVFVPLKLRLRKGREGTLVTEVFLAVIVVLTLLLEVAVFLSLVLVEGGVPGGPPVALVALQPPLLVLGPGVGVEVGQVVGPVLAVLAGEDVLARVSLLMVSQPPSLVRKTGPVATEEALDGWSGGAFLVISACIITLGLDTAVRLSRETGKAANLHHSS